MEGKHFSEWIDLKTKLHHIGRVPVIKKGEIWWCAVGENIGVEINGKSKVFSRPVLIFKKFGRYSFMGIPLTSKPHKGTWYASFTFQGKVEYAVLSQARAISVSRLYGRIGELSDPDYDLILNKFRSLYNGE